MQLTKLKRELFFKQVSQKEVTKIGEVDPAYISRICNGQQKASKKAK